MGPRPHLLLQSGLLPLWAGWFRTGRAGWRSSGWWCRLVSSSPPPCSPTWWTAFLTLSARLYCWIKLPVTLVHRRTQRRRRNRRFRSAALSPVLRTVCLCAHRPTDLLSDLLLLRVPDALPDVLWMDVCARAKLLTVWRPINVIHEAVF